MTGSALTRWTFYLVDGVFGRGESLREGRGQKVGRDTRLAVFPFLSETALNNRKNGPNWSPNWSPNGPAPELPRTIKKLSKNYLKTIKNYQTNIKKLLKNYKKNYKKTIKQNYQKTIKKL